MDDTNVLHPAWEAPRAAGPAFDLSAAKLWRPRARPGSVRRSSLIEQPRRSASRPVISVVAPAGYGKTTLLAQWAEQNGQAFAWVSVDEADNDPKVLLTYVAEALNAVEPVGERVFDALASSSSSVPGSVVPRLSNAFASMTAPVALVLDDVHLLHDFECRNALSVLADHVPAGSRLALAGRAEPPLRVARLRAEGKITEIGPGDLSLTRGEASSLLRAAEVAVGEDEMAELYRRTEGWAVGLYLAALYLREGGTLAGAVASFGGGDRLVSEYVEAEFLARISARDREFLTRTAVLERMSGPLCEAVLELPGSAAALAGLARSNLLLVPLDRRGVWYRYHHLFRDMLLAELERLEPGMIAAFMEDVISIGESAAPDVLSGALCQRSLLAMARGDWDQAEALVREAAAVLRRGRIEDSYVSPLVSAVQARVALHRGHRAEARRALVRAQRLRPLLTYAFPSLAVQARIELARVRLALADIAGTRTLMREVDGLLKRRPGLGSLVGEAQELRDRLAKARDPSVLGASALTGAELRLLPMLCTHLSLPEIGAELFLSPHTIKSQAYSLYRKLEVASRSQAIARARELGLLGE